jgi:hypothetical protein
MMSNQNADKDAAVLQRKLKDLEEQAKLIPLLQMQIQALREERQQLQSQIGSRASSTSSPSPNQPHQPVFQAHRVSPVSLNAMKIAPVIIPKRTTGTNTSSVLSRDVGCSPEVVAKLVQRGTSTDFCMKVDGDGGRLYTERDLKKAIEMAHAKMRKASATVGTQFGENEKEKVQTRSIGCGSTGKQMREISCGTEEPNLMMTMIKGITISPSTVANKTVEIIPTASPLSLKDMNKLPITRTSATQTFNPLTHNQTTQSSPNVTHKATDSNDLIRLVHKNSMTEVAQKRDQIVHTSDLIKFQQAGTNTPPPVVPITRSTASNTNLITVKSVGINCETQSEPTSNLSLNHIGNGSKIPRPMPQPSPNTQRKVFVRQETFTVAKSPPPQINFMQECPAEKMLK